MELDNCKWSIVALLLLFYSVTNGLGGSA